MKKSFLYSLFTFTLVLIGITGVNAETKCYYNENGLGNQKTDGAVVTISDDGSTARAVGFGMYSDDINLIDHQRMVDNEILNWGDPKSIFDAKAYFDSNNNKCPQYLYEYIAAQEPYNDYRYYLLDYSSIEQIKKTKPIFFLAAVSHHLFVYRDDSEDIKNVTTCDYDYFTINYTSTNKVINIVSKISGDKYLTSYETSYAIPSELCQDVYACEYDKLLLGNNPKLIYYTETSAKEMNQGDCSKYSPKKDKASSGVCVKYTNLLNGNPTANMKGLTDYLEKYKSAHDNKDAAAISSSLSDYNSQKDTLVTWCNSVLSESSYSDECLKKCLKLNKTISDLEDKYFNNSDSNIDSNDHCGLSNDLLKFIRNIIKWIRYLIPALVIVLGILDFIKAIGADKDDEMKKAQGRFVKRLIIAALIFIVPWIIEFILDKMGFIAEGCGIIEF